MVMVLGLAPALTGAAQARALARYTRMLPTATVCRIAPSNGSIYEPLFTGRSGEPHEGRGTTAATMPVEDPLRDAATGPYDARVVGRPAVEVRSRLHSV